MNYHFTVCHAVTYYVNMLYPFKDETGSVAFKDSVRTAQ